MSQGVKFSQTKKSYRPSEALVSLLKALQLYQEKALKHEDKKRAGEMPPGKIDEEKADLDREKDNLVKRKVDVLNKHIFPAMANLTILLENMRDKSYIRDTFQDDIMHLFLARSNLNERNKSIFQRFIEGSSQIRDTTINLQGIRGKPLQLTDYRLILCDIMQRSICESMRDIGPSVFDDEDFSENILMVDMRRALAWTKQVSREADRAEVARGVDAKLSYHRKRRPPQF